MLHVRSCTTYVFPLVVCLQKEFKILMHNEDVNAPMF